MKKIFFLLFSLYVSYANAQQNASTQLSNQISEKLFKLIESNDVSEKAQLNKEIEALKPLYYQATTDFLNDKNIDFDFVELPTAVQDSYSKSLGLDFGWKYFKLKTNTKSPLNTKALQLNNIDTLQVVYDPIMLLLIGAGGAYVVSNDSSVNTLYISDASVLYGKPDYITQHEIIHFMFESFRRGKINFMVEAPVHMTFQSQNPIQPKAPMQIYNFFMSYEEMITHAFNIRKVAEATLNNETIPYVVGNQEFLDDSVRKLISISMNALEASHKALSILNRDTIIIDDTTKKFKQLIISNSDDFSFSLFLPAHIDVSNKNEILAYAKKEIEKSIKLANFNIHYFSKSKNTDLGLAQAFMAQQTLFIKGL